MKMIDVRVKDQFNHIYDVKAVLRSAPDDCPAQNHPLFQRIEHIVVNNEVILPSIELLFESQNSANIYRIIGQTHAHS